MGNFNIERAMQVNVPNQRTYLYFFVFLGSGVLETLLMGLVLGDGDCLLWGDDEAPLRTGGGLEEV